MGRKNPASGKKRIRNREHVAQALELRKAGATLQQIGDQLGVTRQRAHQIVSEALRELNEICSTTAEEVRRLELERLDGLLLALYPQRKNPRVADTILRVMDRRAKLLGLDAPILVAPTTPEGKALPGTMDLSRLSLEQLEQLEAIHQAATLPAAQG